MAFFEELGRKAKDVAAVAADKAKDMAAVAADKARETTEKTKISVAIAGEHRTWDRTCCQTPRRTPGKSSCPAPPQILHCAPP